DIVVTDVIPSGLTYVASSISAPAGWTTVDTTAPTLTWSCLDLNSCSLTLASTASLTYQVTVDSPPAATALSGTDTATNNASMVWTSLPGTGTPTTSSDNNTGSQTPGSSGEDDGERDGSGTAPNDHIDSDTVDGALDYFALGNRVWFDTDNSATINGSEVGVSGVKVLLYDSTATTEINVGPDGKLGTADDASGGVTTDSNGYYLFDYLPAGDYVVIIPSDNFRDVGVGDLAPSDPLAQSWSSETSINGVGVFSEVTAPDPDNNTDSDDNGTLDTSGGTHDGAVLSQTVTLGPTEVEPEDDDDFANGSSEDSEQADNRSNLSVDFGFRPTVSIGSIVWSDINLDGLQTAGEPGIAGVTVTLYDVSTGNPVSGVSPQTTGADGLYYFGDLFEDDYYVQIAMPAGYTPTINQNTANNDDSENDSNIQSSPSANTYRSGDFTLTNNGEPNTVNSNIANSDDADNTDDDNGNMTVDFGFNPYALTITKDDGYTVVGPNEVLTYTIDVYNAGAAALTNLTVTDTLPSDVTYQSATPTPTSIIGNVVTWNHAALGIGGDLASGAHVYVTLVAVVNPSPSGSSITNNITVVDSVTSATASDNDTDTIAATSSKALIDTNHAPTTFPDVTIGEILTYRISLIVPAGVTLTTLRATDVLEAGLGFDECQSVTSTDLTSTRAGGIAGACPLGGSTSDPDPAVTNNGHNIVFSFGDVTNSHGTEGRTLTVEYLVNVLDVAANNDGVTGVNNAVTWQWDGGSLTNEALPVDIVEPDMEIEKTTPVTSVVLGSTVPFSLDITHTVESSAHAYDVVVTDVLPEGLEYVPASVSQPSSPPAPATPLPYDSFSYDAVTRTIEIIWDYFPLGESSTVEFDAVFVGPAPSTNVASLAWTSLEIDPGPGYIQSEYNSDSTERWYDPTDLTGVNNYGRSSSVRIDVPLLPRTGFPPNRVTLFPKQPDDKKYQVYGARWLEIPNIKLQLPIFGVPLRDDGWDLTWLDAKAGYLEGTSYPGLPGNTAMTAHVYLPNGQPGPFINLHTLKWGEEVILHANGQRYIYQIRETRKVWPNDLSVLKHEDFDWITLITCQGYNEKENSYDFRTVVRAVLIDVQSE
ncbi:MAG: sortase, partial [Anaerolineae bacterium]|nr:sortase [Anaerolineae bacterium]